MNYSLLMFGNIYLNEVNMFIKHKLYIKYYSGYMDELIILVKSKNIYVL